MLVLQFQQAVLYKYLTWIHYENNAVCLMHGSTIRNGGLVIVVVIRFVDCINPHVVGFFGYSCLQNCKNTVVESGVRLNVTPCFGEKEWTVTPSINWSADTSFGNRTCILDIFYGVLQRETVYYITVKREFTRSTFLI